MSAIVSDFELSFRRIDLKSSPIQMKYELCNLIQLHCDILQLSFYQFFFIFRKPNMFIIIHRFASRFVKAYKYLASIGLGVPAIALIGSSILMELVMMTILLDCLFILPN